MRRVGRSVEILSPFSTTNRENDARAFAAVMKHLRAIDQQFVEEHSTAERRSTNQGRHLRLEPGRFSIQRIKLYRYR